MKDINGSPDSYVVCIDNHGFEASLEKHKIYRALNDDSAVAEGDLLVVDESGEDYLYPVARSCAIEVPAVVDRSMRTGA